MITRLVLNALASTALSAHAGRLSVDMERFRDITRIRVRCGLELGFGEMAKTQLERLL